MSRLLTFAAFLVAFLFALPGFALLGGSSATDPATSALRCPNSLIQCDPRQTSYTKGLLDELTYPILPAQGHAPACSGGETGGCGAFGLDWHNYDGNAPKGAVRGRIFTVPLGVTVVRLRLKYVALAHGAGSTGPLTLQLLAWDGATSVGSVSCTPTSTPTDCVSGAIAVTAGYEYQAQISVNPSGTQSSFNAGRFSVEPVISSVPFWTSGFSRIDVDGIQWDATTLPGVWSNPRRPDALAYAEIKLATNASSFYVESVPNIDDFVAPGGANDARAAFTVDTGLGTATYVPEDTGGNGVRARATTHTQVANVTTNGVSAITLRAGLQALAPTQWTAQEPRGVYFAGLYFPTGSYVSVNPPPRPWFLMAGDSKAISYPSSGQSSGASLMRRRGYNTDWWGIGGDYLAAHVPSASVAAAWPWAQGVATHSPALVFLQLQRNDFVGGTASATVYGLQQSAYDAVEKAAPLTRFRVVQITKEATETSVGGVAWDTHRANVKANACAGNSAVDSQARSNACSVVQNDGLWTSAECAATTCVQPASCVSDAPWCGCAKSRCATDGVHKADAGLEIEDRLFGGEMFPTPSILRGNTVLGWWEADYGISGGTASSVTATGTSPPTVTVAGTSTRTANVIAQIYTAGSTPVAWLSYDGGRSWPLSERFSFNAGTGGSILLPTAPGLTSLGYQITFPAGSYTNDNVWTFASQAGAWAPIGGTATTMGLQAAGHYPAWTAATNTYVSAVGVKQQTISMQCKASSNCLGTSLNQAPPYWIALVGNIDSATIQFTYFGRRSASTGVSAFANSSTVVRFTDGTSNLDSGATTPASPHCYVWDYEASGNSTLYLDGVVNAQGVMGGAATNQGFWLGFDAPLGITGNPTVAMFAVGSGQITADQARGICARAAWKYGTP